MKIILFVIAFFILQTADGQDKEIVSINYAYTPIKGSRGNANSQRLNASVLFPIYNRLPKMIVFGGIGYKSHYLENLPAVYGKNLHAIPVQLGAMYRLDSNHLIMGGIQVSANSDMYYLKKEDLVYQGTVSYRVTYSDRLKIGWGLGFSRQMIGTQIIPVIDINFQQSDKWRFYGKLPVKERVEYTLKPKHHIGVGLDLGTASFRLTQQKQPAGFTRFFQLEGLAYYEYAITKHLRFNIQGAYGIIQRYQFYPEGNKMVFGLSGIWLQKRPEPLQEFNFNSFSIKAGISLVANQ